MKKIFKKIVLIALTTTLIISCDNDDATSGELKINAMVADPGTQINKATPNTQVRVEGSGFLGLKTVVMDNKIPVNFNPAYISETAFIFTVPFDEDKGSRFGVQPITFTTSNGSVTKDFEILQPAPTFIRTVPTRAVPGQFLTIEGSWFYNVSDVSFGGVSIPFVRVNSETIDITVPLNAASGSELVVTTPGGSFIHVVDFLTIVNIVDFDGAGVRPAWTAYGDVSGFNASVTGGPSGNYAQLSWIGGTAFGYNGSSGGSGAKFLSPTNTDASKATLIIDLSCNVINTHYAIQINTIAGKNYGYNFKATSTEWATFEILLSEFKDNYGYGNNLATDLDVSQIDEIKIGLAQGDTPNPSTVNYDNIKLKYD